MVYNGQYYLYEKNPMGDIISVSNSSGTKVATYDYDAWGNITAKSGAMADINPFRYRSYYHDNETDFYCLKTRYYDPEIRRFVNADNYELLPELSGALGQLNLYTYCNNNPVMYTDPDGEFILTSFLIGMGIAAAVGAGVGAIAYTVSEVISYAITGEWSWSWGMFGGSVLGGAVGGALAFALPGLGIAGSAFVSGTLSQGIGMGLQNAWEGTDHSFGDIVVYSLITGGISAITAGLTSKIKVSGFTGRGSISQVARQINTKFYNGTIRRISMQTFGKIAAYEAAYSVFNVFAEVLKNTYNHYKRQGSALGYVY